MLRRLMMAGPGGGDPYWSNVVSLFNGPGQPDGTTFSDAKGVSWSPTGNAQMLSGQAEFDGAGDIVSTAHAAAFDFGSGDFCVEMFGTIDTTGNQVFIGKRNSGGYTPFGIGIFSGKLQMLVSLNGTAWGSTAADPSSFPTATEQHFALERSGSTVRLLRQGSVVATYTIGGSAVMFSMDNVTIGMWGGSLYPLDGRIRAWRITKGAARYAGTYTVPTVPFPTS